MPSRRQFLARSALGLAGLAVGGRATADSAAKALDGGVDATAPPAFGTAPPVGPNVSAATFAEAEKLMQVTLTRTERAQAASNWRSRWRRCTSGALGPRKVALGDGRPAPADRAGTGVAVPAPRPPGGTTRSLRALARRAAAAAGARRGHRLRAADVAVALDRVAQADLGAADDASTSSGSSASSRSSCAASPSRATRRSPQARRADAEIARGHYRGPLHGMPWGAKDLGRHRRHRHHLGRRAVPQPRARRATRPSCERLPTPAPCSWPSSAWARSRSTTSGSAGRPRTRGCSTKARRARAPGPASATAAGLVGFALGSRDAGQHRLAVDALRRRPACARPSAACRAPAP